MLCRTGKSPSLEIQQIRDFFSSSRSRVPHNTIINHEVHLFDTIQIQIALIECWFCIFDCSPTVWSPTRVWRICFQRRTDQMTFLNASQHWSEFLELHFGVFFASQMPCPYIPDPPTPAGAEFCANMEKIGSVGIVGWNWPAEWPGFKAGSIFPNAAPATKFVFLFIISIFFAIFFLIFWGIEIARRGMSSTDIYATGQRDRLANAIERTLLTLEQKGGPNAAINIKVIDRHFQIWNGNSFEIWLEWKQRNRFEGGGNGRV